MKKMSLVEQIGQKLVIGLPGLTVDDTFRELVRTYKIGNVVLFARNIKSKEQFKALTEEIQNIIIKETGTPAFITLDQEGGTVVRLSEDCTNIPGAMALAATNDPEKAKEAARLTGTELKALGVNFNLSPVLDINSNPDNPVIGVRSFGDTPDIVSRFGIPFFKEMLAQDVLAVGKHFPGHGDTAEDSHLALPLVNKTMDELYEMELRPFQDAIAAKIPAIMSSHIRFPAIEPEKIPATMSRKVLTGLLREEMGFKGLILTDCLEMDAIKAHFGTAKGAVAAAKAGADLLLISHTYELAKEAAILLKEAVESGEISRDELEASVERILQYKNTYGKTQAPPLSVVGSEEHRAVSARLLESTLTPIGLSSDTLPSLGEHPLFLGSPPYRPSIASNPADESLIFPENMKQAIGGLSIVTPVNPTPKEIDSIADELSGLEISSIVFATYNAHLATGQLELLKRLAEKGAPMIVVAFQNPYDLKRLPRHVVGLAAYEYSSAAFTAVEKALTGKIKVTGVLPVQFD